MQIKDEKATPNASTGETPVDAVFSCLAFTKNNNITSVQLDLSPLGGGTVSMNDVSGGTNWQYNYTVPAGLSQGIKELRLTATDDQGYTLVSYIYFKFLIRNAVVFQDFETGTAEGWFNYWGSATGEYLDYYFDTMNPEDQCIGRGGAQSLFATNLNWYDNPYHGDSYIGWEYNVSTNNWNGGAYSYGGCYDYVRWNHTPPCGDGDSRLSSSDMRPYAGIIYWIYVEDNGTIYPDSPIMVRANLQATSWSDWWDMPHVNLKLDKWTKVMLDFSGKLNKSGGGDYPDAGDLDDVIEYGFVIEGGFTTSGMTVFAVDYVTSFDDWAPEAPAVLTVTDPGTGGTLLLNWTAPADTDVERYNIYQSDVKDPDTAVFVASTPDNFYYDKGVWNGLTYYYWVTAVDFSENEGEKSADAGGIASGATPIVEYPYKGVNVYATSSGDLQNAEFNTELTRMANSNVNSIGIVVKWYMNNATANDFMSNASTLPDEDIIHAIQDIQSEGMKVFLKLDIEVQDGTGIHEINPATPSTWFNNYNSLITKYATIAENESVDLFSVGNNLYSMTVDAYNSDWDTIIGNIDGIYNGETTYCANWGNDKYITSVYTNQNG